MTEKQMIKKVVSTIEKQMIERVVSIRVRNVRVWEVSETFGKFTFSPVL